MENTKLVAEKMKIVPRLKLGNKKIGGGVESTGAHLVKFISDSVVKGKDPMTKKEREEMKYIVEKNGVQYQWRVPLLNKQNEPHYLIERLMTIKEGEEVVLEMKKSGMNNFIDVRPVNQADEEMVHEEISEEIEDF